VIEQQPGPAVRARRLARSGLAAVLAAVLPGLAAGCGSGVSGLDGSLDQGDSAGVSVLPGQPADYTGFLISHTGQVVTLKSARLLPLRGFHPPRLIHVALEPGKNFAASDTGWPPNQPRFRLERFAGARIPSSGSRIDIMYSVTATRLGDYADDGIRVTVLGGGGTATVDVISAAGTCIVRSENTMCPQSFQNRLP